MRIITIFGLEINVLYYPEMLRLMKKSIIDRKKTLITYANAAVLNNIYSEPNLPQLYKKFDIIHADGIGIVMASRILFGKVGSLRRRFVGSDFFPIFTEESTKHDWRIFFLGDTDKTLDILIRKKTGLNIVGRKNGFDLDEKQAIQEINESKPDVLFVGMGVPKQESFIIRNADVIDAPVVMAIGEGIKVFAGIKIRGPVFMRKMGLEWLVRVIFNPRRYFKRSIIGIPLFMIRVFLLKRKFRYAGKFS